MAKRGKTTEPPRVVAGEELCPAFLPANGEERTELACGRGAGGTCSNPDAWEQCPDRGESAHDAAAGDEGGAEGAQPGSIAVGEPAVEAVTEDLADDAAVFETVGVYANRVAPHLRSVIRFPGRAPYRSEFTVGWMTWDGLSIGPGLAMQMGLRPGDQVRVRLERVTG